MKAEDIDNLSEREAKERLKRIYESPYIKPFFSIQNQLDNLSTEIENATIKIDEKTFDSFIKWGEKSMIIADNLQTMLSRIDSEILEQEKEKRLSAKKGSVEARRKNA